RDIDDWRRRMAGNAADLARAAARVRKRVWSPLEPHLKGARVVLVSPEGALCRLPFAALPGKAARSYLIEDVAVGVVPAPQLLPELLRKPGADKGPRPSLLVVGDVDFDRGRSSPASPGRWVQLPATRPEADSVKEAFVKRFGGTVTDLRGAE